MDSPTTSVPKSRLEINFIRLLDETQQMANGNKPKDWSFTKFIEDRNILILYGSQTGTAEETAERIGREAERYFIQATVKEMNSVAITDLLKGHPTVFVASTTGQGDDPDNMKDFFQNLWKCRKNTSLLKPLKYCVLGLGDSSYQKFNYSAKRLNNLLSLLGAASILKIGLADDQHDLGPDFIVDSWVNELWSKIIDIMPLPSFLEPMSANFLVPPKYQVEFIDLDANTTTNTLFFPNDKNNFNESNPYFSCITQNKRITSEDHFQDVRLVEFDTKGMPMHSPGDIVMIQPYNLDEHVKEFIEVLSLQPNKMFKLSPNKNHNKVPFSYIIPSPCTVEMLIKNYLDIMSIPKRYFFELLSHFTTDETEKEKFIELSSSAGQQELYDYCNRPKRSILEVLADFPHTNKNIPFEYLFDLIPSIKPRAYSIASSSNAIPGKIQIAMAVVNYKTNLRRPRLGLCTNWLARLELGTKVPIWLKKGTLKFPDPKTVNKNTTCIMIGPGTGCSPFRSYIQECVQENSLVKLILFFGCRYSLKDNLFNDEWEALVKEKKMLLFSAYSRDQEDKIYVQHLLRENAKYLWELFENPNTQIFYAGNAKRVPIDIYEALTYICEKGLNDVNKANTFMSKVLQKRYHTETWA